MSQIPRLQTPPPDPNPLESSPPDPLVPGTPVGTLTVIGVLMLAILGMWGLVFALMLARS